MKKIISSIKRILNYLKPTKKELLMMGIVFTSFSVFFASGSLNSNTKVEQISSEISRVVKDGNKAYLFCESEEKRMTSNERFSQYVNDRFFDIAPFRSVIGYNLDKTVECSISELGEYGTSPSFLTSTYFTNHIDDERIIFDRYYFELLYKETNTDRSGGFDNFAYITKSQADYLISNDSSLTSYDDVLNTSLTFVSGDNVLGNWKVANIIVDDGMFCNEAKIAFNNYLICFTLVPNILKDTESMLFSMSGSSYLNIDYISLLENYFPAKDYYFHTNGGIASLEKLSTYLNKRSDNIVPDAIVTMLIVFFTIPFLVISFFMIKQDLLLRHLLEFIIVSFATWFLFFLIYKISKSILLFSFTSLAIFFIVFSLFLLWMFVLWLVKKYGKRNTII